LAQAVLAQVQACKLCLGLHWLAAMATARPRKAKDAASGKDDFENSILARLGDEYQQQCTEEEFTRDVAVFFCGMKRSGKTSLVERFINPSKDDKDPPKPTVALDYKFARYAAETSSSKTLAHIFDLGGDEINENLISLPVAPANVASLVLVVTLDLSDPHHVVPCLENWLGILRSQVVKSLDALAKESPNAARHVEAMKEATQGAYAGHADEASVRPFPVSLVIVGAKWDIFAAEADPEKRKNFCRALRYFAHVNGAWLLSSAKQDKVSMNNMRALLRQLLFGVASKGGLTEQLDSAKPLCISPGKDSLSAIGVPHGSHGGEQAWRELCQSLFPDPQPAQKGKQRSAGEQVGDELLKYPEGSVDGMVEQRVEELNQYRRQVERNQRLASEGVDGSKITALSA